MIKQEIDGKADTVPFEAPVDQTLTPHSLFFFYLCISIYYFYFYFFGGGAITVHGES